MTGYGGDLMPSEMLLVLTAVFAVWGVAVAVKAFNTLRGRKAYRFSMWDGGLLRVGRQLTRLGAQIKSVVGMAMSAGCIVILIGVLPWNPGVYVVGGIALVSIVSDLVNVQPA